MWVLYAEAIYCNASQKERDIIGNEGVLPVPQCLLQTREDALAKLRDIEHLERSLQELFPRGLLLVDKTLTALKH